MYNIHPLLDKRKDKDSNIKYTLVVLFAIFLLSSLYSYGQLASSTTYILRTSNTGESHSPIGATSFKIESTNYAATATIGEPTASPSSQLTSINYKVDVGFTPTWNLPPKPITNLTFPEQDRYLYTSKPPFLFANAGDWDYTGFGITDKLHFEISVSIDLSFSTINYLANTRNSTLNWFTTASSDANNCLFNQIGCAAFTSSGVDSSSTDSIKHITLTDLSLNSYYWKVKAFDDFEYGEDSNKPLFHYILPIVSTTSPNNGQTINSSSAVLSWLAPPGANKYQIQTSRTCDFSDAVDFFVNSPNLSLNLTNLQDGKYCWRIRPLDILGNPSNYTSTFVFFIVTIPVLGVRLLAEFYVVPPETTILLRAYLLGPQDQIVNILNINDIDIFITGKNPPGEPGTLFDKKSFSDRIEITFRSPLSAGITSIRALENRSGNSFSDNINIVTSGKLLMLEGQFNPKNIIVKVGEEVVIANFKFWAVSENIKLNDLFLQLPPIKVSKILKQLKLVEDVNNDGKYTDGVDRIVGVVARTEFDTPQVTFAKIVELLPRNVPINYLLLGTFGLESTEGDFYIDFVPANSGNAWGLISHTPIGIDGLNFRAGPFKVQSGIKTFLCKWSFAAANFPSRKFSSPLTNVQAINFLVSAIDSPCVWNNPAVRISGTGIDNVHISSVKLIEDINGNGIYEPIIDRTLATGRFSSDDGALNFPLSISLPTQTTRYFFILLDISNSSNNATYQVYMRKSEQNVIINNSPSKFTGPDFLYGTLLTNISTPSGGFVNIINNSLGSLTKSLKPHSKNEIMSFTLYNSNLEDVHLRELTINLVLDPLKTSFITFAYLYLDTNKNGKIDAGDTLLKKELFLPDNSPLPQVKFSDFDVAILKNEYKSFVISVDLTAMHDVTINMRTLIQNSGALVIGGSPQAEVAGIPLSSEQQVLEKSTDSTEPPPQNLPQISFGGGGGCFIHPHSQKNKNNDNPDFLLALILIIPLIGIIIKRIILNDYIITAQHTKSNV